VARYEQALMDLVHVGKFVFETVFPDSATRQAIRNALYDGAVVEIASNDFSLPWEFLYDGTPSDKDAPLNHWGMKYIISRFIIQNNCQGAFAMRDMEVPRPVVGFIYYNELRSVVEQEHPDLKELHRKKHIKLIVLQALSMTQRNAGLEELRRFLSQEMHILHFACHAYEQSPIERSFLHITQDFRISMIDFVVCQYVLHHHPFVILNACLTSVIDPRYTSSWATYLWKHGAKGVLATDFHVPDRFAAAFSRKLYQHLLQNEPIGPALLAIRQEFWHESNQRNLLALAYALYSPPSIRLRNSRNRRRKF